MSEVKFCPQCGSKLQAEDRFCGECGYHFNSQENKLPPPPPIRNYEPVATPVDGLSGGNTSRRNMILIIVASVVLVLTLGGGGLYWWLSSRKDQRSASTSSPSSQENIPPPVVPREPIVPTVPEQAIAPETQPPPVVPPTPTVDLSKATTYLSKKGLKCTFFVNYPDGESATVERISGLGLPNESIIISEVEVVSLEGEQFGYGNHYIEEADGTYYITDGFYEEAFPVLKNNLAVGHTWTYSSEYGDTHWTVLEMGVSLDLGFHQFEDCLVLEEDNQPAEFQSVSYYAPGYGIVYVTSLGGEMEFYKMTQMTQIDVEEAKNEVIKWSSLN